MRIHFATLLLLAAMAARGALAASALTLRSPDGKESSLSRFEDLATVIAKNTTPGDWRLVIQGPHTLQAVVHLALKPGQRLVIEGGPDALLELSELPQKEAAICLDVGQFELHGLTLIHGPACSIQISQGVRYHLHGLRISDARGGGIAVWGPCGVDQSGPTGNCIEQCIVERFNSVKAKWSHDAISVRDNEAIISQNIIRDSLTETMGIRVMGSGNRIEGNLVQNVATGDAGGIYLWGGEAIYTAVGNLVRHNIVVGASRGIYLDDGTCAARVEQNYLVDCREVALLIGGGRDNRLDQNVALRCPILAHMDNRRTGWRDAPEKAAMFAAARSRLFKAFQDAENRRRIIARGLDVGAFENVTEAEFNEPADNLVTRNVMMPAAQELRLQNYAHPDRPLVATATDPAKPNRASTAPAAGDWASLSNDAIGIPDMPEIAKIVQALPKP